MGLHQGFALSLFFFNIVMDELTKRIQEELPWCMLFVDDIILVDEIRKGVNGKSEQWRHIVESRGFRISRSKAEYLHCCFSGREDARGEVTIEGIQIPKVKKFKYLGSIIHHEGDIDEDISNRIKVSWQKWKYISIVLCDKRMPVRLKYKVYRMKVRPVLYTSDCWPIKKTQVQRLMVAEMRMIRRICGYRRMDRISNWEIRDLVKVIPIEDKLREIRLKWFGHVKRRSTDAPVRRCEIINIPIGKRGKRQPKKSLDEVIREDLKVVGLTKDIAQDRRLWLDRIKILVHRGLAL